MKNWSKRTLGEIAEFTNGGAWNQGEYVAIGVPVVRVSDIKDGTITSDNSKFLSVESFAKYKKHTLFAGDLVIATVGSHPVHPASVVGRTAIVPPSAQGALLNQNAVRVAPSCEYLDKSYLGYLGKSQHFRNYIIQHARGSANQVRMSISLLKQMDTLLPPLSVQRKIASVLSAYDDLIEKNTRRIEILEEMAQAIYREWFVNFRFPGHEKVEMVNSVSGPIPDGWRRVQLGEVADQVRRSVRPEQVAPDTPYVGLEHIPRKSIALSEWGTAEEVQSTKLAFNKDEILFGKIRPYFHKVAVAPIGGLCSSDTIVITPRATAHFPAVLCTVSSEEFVDHATQTSQGTKMPRADWNVLVKYPVVIPSTVLLERFNELVEDIVSQIQNLVFRNRNLRRTRDLLLPKLISGEIDVEQAGVEFEPSEVRAGS